MKKDQYKQLGRLWNQLELPTYDDFIAAIGGIQIKLDTIPEAMVYYGALKRLSIKDQIAVHSMVTVEKNITMTNLLNEWVKVSNALGDAAVNETNSIINQK